MSDCVGAVGNQRAGHDADRSSGFDFLCRDASGGQVFDHFQACRRICDVVGADGVTVHRGVVGLRDVGVRDDVLAQHAAECVGERDLLRAEDRNLREHALLRFFDGDHLLASAGSLEGRQ